MIELFLFWTIAGAGATLAFAVTDSMTGMRADPTALFVVASLSGPLGWLGLALFVVSYRATERKLAARGKSHE